MLSDEISEVLIITLLSRLFKYEILADGERIELSNLESKSSIHPLDVPPT